MKTYIRTNLLLAAALSALALVPASTATTTAVAYPVSQINTFAGSLVIRGDSRMTVRDRMGVPNRRVTSDVWIYSGYYASNLPQPNPQRCNAMVITFAGNRVSDIKFVNSSAIGVIVAQATRSAPVRYAVAE